LVDIFQPCISFNKVNNFQWYKKNTYPIPEGHPVTDLNAAFELAMKTEKYPLGILYKKDGVPSYEDKAPVYLDYDTPVISRRRDISKVNTLI
jgi:2-oxoglutarate ferredoxin oxidoreductase subunit beta